MQEWLIKDVLLWTAGYFKQKEITEPRLEAEVLLAHVLKSDRVYLYVNYTKPVNPQERVLYREYIKRRIAGEPLAYITGCREFMSLNFQVAPGVLIPRPETETLVEQALQLIRQNDLQRICDMGTGSGAIAVSLAYYAGEKDITAIDLSADAIRIAQANANRFSVPIKFCQGDLFDPVRGQRPFDLITANLPYVSEAEFAGLNSQVKAHEPGLALLAGPDGLDLYRRFVSQCHAFLSEGGYLLMEVAPGQAETVRDWLPDYEDRTIVKDYAGRNRVVKARKGS